MRYCLLVTTMVTSCLVTSCTPYYGTVRHNHAYSNKKEPAQQPAKASDQKPDQSAIRKTPEPPAPKKKESRFDWFKRKQEAKQKVEENPNAADIPVIALNRHDELPRVEDLKSEDITEAAHFNTDVVAEPMDDVTDTFEHHHNATVTMSPVQTPYQCDPGARENITSLLNAAAKGDVHAYARLGEVYLNGQGVPVDLHRAVEWYSKAAYEGLPLAQLQLGDLYRDGVGVKKNNCEAISWYTKAAHQGNITAMLRMGEMYKGWYHNPPNRNLAFKWYRQAASLGSDEAQTQVHLLLAATNSGGMDKMEHGHSIRSLTQQAQMGNMKAMMELGDRYYYGNGVRRNVKLAVQYYKSAAKLGSAEAAYKAGDIYYYGRGVKEDPPQGLILYKRAGDLGMARAKFKVAEIYFHGEGVPRDVALAKDWYLKATDQNYPPAQAALGDMYLSGVGVPRYYPRAFYWYDVASKHGDTYAKFMLSILYAKGQGVELDLAKSVEYYNQAAGQEDAYSSQARVAKNYAVGFGLPRNGAEALRWYSLAATEGYAPAQADLGDMLSSGNIVSADYESAIEWYTLAATNGLPYGQYSLALALLEGKGTDTDPQEALSWLKKAAYQGYRPAQYELGRLYFEGNVIKRNDVRAYGWWSLSLQDMNDITPESLSVLIERMEPGYRERAVLLAERYKQRFGGKLAQKDEYPEYKK